MISTEPKDVISVPTMDEVYKIRDALNLTDRQRELFVMAYSRRIRYIDMAEELDICQDTVTADMKIIREKLAQFSLDKLNGK